jgi:Protein of unknown function (DUF4236)
MGTFFRKSFKVGPLKLNLSKSGLGVSAGMKGAHIGLNARGRSYVSGGKDGIYFRENLASSGQSGEASNTFHDEVVGRVGSLNMNS